MKKLQLANVWIIVTLLALSSIIVTSPKVSTNHPPMRIDGDYHTSDSPITIQSNSDFATQGWPGNGTKASPYLIENRTIVTDGDCIVVRNTSVYFEIRNSYLSSKKDPIYWRIWNVGVLFENVRHGMIHNTTIIMKRLSVVVRESNNCTIANCSISESSLGIHILGPYPGYSKGCIISNNTIVGINEAVLLTYAMDCTVANNTLLQGISVQESADCKVLNNVIDCSSADRWSYYGSLWDSSRITVVGNEFINSGLELAGFVSNTDHVISYNTVNGKPLGYFFGINDTILQANAYGQFVLVNCHNVTVRDGLIDNTAIGCHFISCSNSSLKNGTVSNSSMGVSFAQSQNCSVEDSVIISNLGFGVYIRDSTFCRVINNSIRDTEGIGVFITMSITGGFGNRIYYNSFAGNGYGTTYPNDGNACDDGHSNIWDDGVSLGNFWDDYKGTGAYPIPGESGSRDWYPSRMGPLLVKPKDVNITYGSTGNEVVWLAYNLEVNQYSIFLDGTVVLQGPFSDWYIHANFGHSLTISVDGLQTGTHNLTLALHNLTNIVVTDTVLVNVMEIAMESTTTTAINGRPPPPPEWPFVDEIVLISLACGIVIVLIAGISLKRHI